MVGYDCPHCNGSGYEKVVTIRGGNIKQTKEDCLSCFGAGTMTNGKPDVYFDVGVMDPSWKEWLK